MPLILIIIGLVLIIYNYRAIKKENEIKQEEDSFNISFQSVLQDSKEELSDYKMEIGILRKDIAESLTELQEEILEIKNNLNKLKNNEKVYENKESLESGNFLNETDIDREVDKQYDESATESVKEQLNEIDNNIANEIDENIIVNPKEDKEVICEIDFSGNVDSNKTQNIKKLLKEGLTEDQICHELSVSKGEVLLVKGLFKK